MTTNMIAIRRPGGLLGNVLSSNPASHSAAAANPTAAQQHVDADHADGAQAQPPGSLSSTQAGSAEGMPAGVAPLASFGASGPSPQQHGPPGAAQYQQVWARDIKTTPVVRVLACWHLSLCNEAASAQSQAMPCDINRAVLDALQAVPPLPASPTSAFCKFVPAAEDGSAALREPGGAASAAAVQDCSVRAAQQALRERHQLAGRFKCRRHASVCSVLSLLTSFIHSTIVTAIVAFAHVISSTCAQTRGHGRRRPTTRCRTTWPACRGCSTPCRCPATCPGSAPTQVLSEQLSWNAASPQHEAYWSRCWRYMMDTRTGSAFMT